MEMTVEYINEIPETKDPVISVDDLNLDADGAALSEEMPLAEIPSNTLVLKRHQASGIEIEEIGEAIHAGSTDIEW